MESNLKLSKIPRLYWMILDASPELIPQLLYPIENGFTKLTRFVLASTHFDGLVWEGHTGYWTKRTDLDENTSEKQFSETCHF